MKSNFKILFLAVLSTMIGLGIIIPLLPIYAQTLGATGIWIGVIFSAFSFSRSVFIPIVGRLSDKFGRKKFITYGLLLFSISSLFYVISETIFQLTMARVIQGLASAMVVPVSLAVIGDMAPKGEEGKSMGIFTMAFFTGMGIGPFMGGIINQYFGMNWVFYSMGIFTFVPFLFVAIKLREPKRKAGRKGVRLKDILRDKILRGIFVYRFTNAIGRGGFITFLPIFVKELGLSSSKMGLLVSINIFAAALIQYFGGKLADRFSRKFILVLGMSLANLFLILVPFTKSFILLLVLSLFFGLLSGITFPSLMALGVEAGNRVGMGSSMATLNMALSLGMIIAPILSGFIVDTLGIEYVFFIGGLVSYLGIFLFFIMSKGIKGAEKKVM